MRINNNIMAMNAHRQLGINQTGASKSMEKLSSGFRINRAGDDAAGLAISEKMRGQIRGLKQAQRNAQDGISLIQTAEGALNETHAILQRMRELANQAASDTNVAVDRNEIQKEINQLTSEINRIGNTTEFNTMRILDGSRSAQFVTAGAKETTSTVVAEGDIAVGTSVGVTNPDGAIQLDGESLTISAYAGFDWTKVAENEGSISITKTATGELEVVISATDEDGNVLEVTDSFVPEFEGGKFTYNAHGVSFTITEDAFNDASDATALEIDLAMHFDNADSSGNTNYIGKISTFDSWADNAGGLKITAGVVVDEKQLNAAFGGLARSIDVSFDGTNKFTVTIYDDVDGGGKALSTDEYTVSDASELEGASWSYSNHGITFVMEGFAAAAADFEAATTNALNFETTEIKTVDPADTEDRSLAFQIGANEAQALNLSINDMRAVGLGISSTEAGGGFGTVESVTDGTDSKLVEYSLDVSTHQNAAQALTTIDSAIEKVSAERSMLGAIQNRLEHTISNLGTSAENLQAAEARIRDLDMAEEIMAFTKNNILQQAATAMLAQANMAPQSVLQLLG